MPAIVGGQRTPDKDCRNQRLPHDVMTKSKGLCEFPILLGHEDAGVVSVVPSGPGQTIFLTRGVDSVRVVKGEQRSACWEWPNRLFRSPPVSNSNGLRVSLAG